MQRVGLIVTLSLPLCFSATGAQPPAKAPALPPINPAQARLAATISGLDGPGFAIAYGDAAGVLAAACERGTIQIWHKDVLLGIRAGSGTPHLLRGHQGPVLALAWNGGPILASTGSDRKVLLWSIKDAAITQISASAVLLRALAMSPDGNLLAGGGEASAITLWDVPGAEAKGKLAEHQDWVNALAFSPDSKLLASADNQGKVLLWDVPAQKKIRDLTPTTVPPPKVPPDPVPVDALAFSPDGKTLAVGSNNGLIQLVNVADGKLQKALPGHTSSVTGLAFHPSGILLVSSSKDRTLRLWNPATGQALKTLDGHEAWVEGVVFTTQGTRLASVSADQTVRLWDLTEPMKK